MNAGESAGQQGWRPGGRRTRLEDEMLYGVAAGVTVTASGPQRKIRAAVLRHLLVCDDWPVHEKGVRLCGFRISGHLDLEGATLRCPLLLDSCYLAEPVVLTSATVSLLALTRCYVAGFKGDALVVTRHLDLGGSTFTEPLRLAGADITGGLSCRGTQLKGADREGRVLVADDMKAGSYVLLDQGISAEETVSRRFTAKGTVSLARATVGYLSCRGARMSVGKENYALFAERIKVGGDVFLDQLPGHGRFTAVGTVWLAGADITGNLVCAGAQLHGAKDGAALFCGGIKIGGGLFLAGVHTSTGAIHLRGANITDNLYCNHAQLNGVDEDGNALNADWTKIGSHLLLNEEFAAAGTIYLQDANITGNLECCGAQLKGPGSKGWSLAAERMKVGADVYLTESFAAADGVQLRAATIGGALEIAPSKLGEDQTTVALDATGARITGKLRWEPENQVLGEVSLQETTVGLLEDSWTDSEDNERPNGYWPAGGNLHLDGLAYGNILTDRRGGEVGQRLAWIKGQYRLKENLPWTHALFHPRASHAQERGYASWPYKQLAQVFQQDGKDTEARQVAIAQRRDLREFGHLTWYRRAFSSLLDFFIGYGYQTWKAGAYLVVLYGIVLAFVLLASHHNAIVPNQDITLLHPKPTALSCASDYPCFSPAGYAIDTVIPLINVHQADYWGPNASVAWGLACVVITYLGTLLGWLLLTFAVAGATGLVSKTEPS